MANRHIDKYVKQRYNARISEEDSMGLRQVTLVQIIRKGLRGCENLMGRKVFWVMGTASAKARRQETVGIFKKQGEAVQPEQREPGKGGVRWDEVRVFGSGEVWGSV